MHRKNWNANTMRINLDKSNLINGQLCGKVAYLPIEDVLNVREFRYGITLILHDLGVMTSVDHHTNDPVCVLQGRPTQHKVAVVKINHLSVKLVDLGAKRTQCSLESIEHVVGSVTHNMATQSAQPA